MYAKHGGYGGLGIDPNAVSYVQPVAIVPAGAPIAAVPLGPGGFKDLKGHHKGIKGTYGPPKGSYGVPNAGYGAPPLLPGAGLGLGLNSLAPPPLLPPPGGLPVAPVQHLHHHVYDGGVTTGIGYKKGGAGAYNGAVQTSPIVPSPVYNTPAVQPYNPPPPAYNPPPPPPPPRPVYNNPPRPGGYGGAIPNPAYSNQQPISYSPRDQCVCVPVDQCASYDVIGRVNDYQIDPRSKLNSSVSADDDVLIPTAEGRNSTARRRRQSFHHKLVGRQTIIGDDSVTVISSDAPADFVPGVSSPSSPPAADDAIETIAAGTPAAESPSGDAVSSPVGAAGVSLTKQNETNDTFCITQSPKAAQRLTSCKAHLVHHRKPSSSRSR